MEGFASVLWSYANFTTASKSHLTDEYENESVTQTLTQLPTQTLSHTTDIIQSILSDSRNPKNPPNITFLRAVLQ